ncbi:hypothetical protein AAWM_08145 [Aspergillus awamori]|uniref:Uncharacterized protein n=1 Tax=Aspergillus awamori TaxID=105351 RepID=A0A401L173_ASPAW|nr:hypothetical protein AAWM_08145 [Aspergillus awamori]
MPFPLSCRSYQHRPLYLGQITVLESELHGEERIGRRWLAKHPLCQGFMVRPSTTIGGWLYVASFILSNAHLPFVPRLLAAEEQLLGEQQKAQEESLAALQDWLKVNSIRVLVVDLPLLLVTTAAALASENWQ